MEAEQLTCKHCTETFNHPQKRARHAKKMHKELEEGEQYLRAYHVCKCCNKEHQSATSKAFHEQYSKKKLRRIDSLQG
jgi:hypothetical protein